MWNREVEVARYALTRRLVPVLRHHLVVHLQPTGMLCEAAESKLGAAPLDQDSLRDTVTRIGDHARALVELRWIFLAFKPSRSIKCHKKSKGSNGGKNQPVKDTGANGGKHSDKGTTDRKSGSPAGSQNKGDKITTP